MSPPAVGETGKTDAPFREWLQVRAYDTAKACEADRTQIFRIFEKGEKGSAAYKQIASSLCIASDDPRLK
jgi:hypothetical protein